MGFFFQAPARRYLWQLASLCLCLIGTTSTARGQIIPDATLPKNTVVTSTGKTSAIEQGTQVGGNLFHSFREFSVPTGGVAWFNNGLDVQNIISRVTGGNISKIDGTIRTGGSANLFLINPNGIVFGRNAQLNIGGSLIASTANSIKFADGSEFSATKPQASPLLTINVPIGLQFGSNPKSIINQSQATSSQSLSPQYSQTPIPSNVGLQVLPGRTLALVGGDVSLDGGNLTVQGRIELGSVANSGFVSLTPTPSTSSNPGGFALGYEGIQNFGNINLSNGAAVNASGLAGGTIRVRGGQVTLTQGSGLVAETFGSASGGGIDIQATQFKVQDQAFVSTSTFGSGAGGSLSVRADTVELTGTAPGETAQRLLSGTFISIPERNSYTSAAPTVDTTQAGCLCHPHSGSAGVLDPNQFRYNPLNLSDGLFSLSGGSGAAGNITIDAGRLIVQNGANVLTTTFTNGAGGNLTVRVAQLAELSNGSLLFTGTAGSGNAGNLAIAAQQLRVLDGTSISTTSGPTSSGRGGNLSVTAQSVELRGTPALAVVPGGLFTSALGGGDAGNLTVTTGQLVVADGTQISTSSSGQGRAGDLTVSADSVELSGISADGRFLGGMFASSSLLTVPGQSGNAPAGNLWITTRQLSVKNGAQISAATGSEGGAGNLTINSKESVEVSGFATGVDQSVGKVAFNFRADGMGKGIVPSAIETNTSGAGNAGDLRIYTGRLTVRDGAEIGVRSTSSGSAGDLTLKADSILLENQGTLSAVNVAGSRGGNIELDARTVQLNNGAINASTLGRGRGGDITIRAPESVEVIGTGLPNLLQTIFFPALFGRIDLNNTRQGIVTASAGEGTAGKITIETGQFRMRDGGLMATTTLGTGASGDLKIKAGESVDIRSSFIATATVGAGAGGKIEIDTPRLRMQDVGVISATTLSSGKGGNITVRASESVELSGALANDSAPNGKIPTNLTAGAPQPTTGNGGDISITTPKLIVRDGAEVSVSSQGSGKVGRIDAIANSLFLNNGSITATSVLGEGGDINLRVRNDTVLRNRSQISTRAGTQNTGGGNGGNITIDTGLLAAVEKSDINANAFSGAGGNIRINTTGFFVSRDSSITASSKLGVNGVVEINELAADPSKGLFELPENFTDPSHQITTGCAANPGTSFVVTGRGGLPEDPTGTLRGRTVWRDLRNLSAGRGGFSNPPLQSSQERKVGRLKVESFNLQPSTPTTNNGQSKNNRQLVEAQGWVINAHGQLELVAQVPNGTPQHPWNKPANCGDY